MSIIVILGGLLIVLAFACWSSARSYFERGRLRGMEEAAREIIKGISRHYELEGREAPEGVAKAIKATNAVFENHSFAAGRAMDQFHVQLSFLGNEIGEACWVRGHAAGVRRKAPAEGFIRVDLSLNELLQLSWLAHVGFLHMMPNYRGFEFHRFGGEEDAAEGAKAVSQIEAKIPATERPFADFSAQSSGRLKLISDWWQVVPIGRTA